MNYICPGCQVDLPTEPMIDHPSYVVNAVGSTAYIKCSCGMMNVFDYTYQNIYASTDVNYSGSISLRKDNPLILHRLSSYFGSEEIAILYEHQANVCYRNFKVSSTGPDELTRLFKLKSFV